MEKWVPITSDLQKNIWLAIVWTQTLWNGGEGYLSFMEKGKERIYTEKKWLMCKKNSVGWCSDIPSERGSIRCQR